MKKKMHLYPARLLLVACALTAPLLNAIGSLAVEIKHKDDVLSVNDVITGKYYQTRTHLFMRLL